MASQPDNTGAEIINGIKSFGWHLSTCRPNMAPIANTVASCIVAAMERLDNDIKVDNGKASEAFEDVRLSPPWNVK